MGVGYAKEGETGMEDEQTLENWVITPSEFDQRVYNDPEEIWQALRTMPEHPIVVARLAQTAAIRFNNDDLQHYVNRLAEVQGPLYPGVYAWICSFSGPAGVPEPQGDVMVTGASPLELENTFHHASARAILHTKKEEWDEANAYLLLARTLSRALGMTNRTQNLTIEQCRVNTLQGKPAIAELQEQLLEAMPPRRVQWSARTLAESHMSLGNYREALTVLGPASNDCEASGAMREFLHALLGLPELHQFPESRLPYMQLAKQVRSNPFEIPSGESPLFQDVEAGYKVLLDAYQMLGDSAHARHASRSLIGRQIQQPDQRVFRALLLMRAIADGQPLHPGLRIEETPWREYDSAAEKMTSTLQLLELIARLDPNLVALLYWYSQITGKHRVPTAGGLVPVLVGKSILHHNKELPIPTKAGRVLVLKALGLPTEDVTRTDRSRFKKWLEAQQFDYPLINMGWVARGCIRLSQTAALHGQRNDAAAWYAAAQSASEVLSPCVREVLSQYPIPA